MKQPVLKSSVFSTSDRQRMLNRSNALTEAVNGKQSKETNIKPIDIIQIPKKVKPYQQLKEANIAFGNDVRETFIAKTAEIVFESFWLDSAIKEKNKEALMEGLVGAIKQGIEGGLFVFKENSYAETMCQQVIANKMTGESALFESTFDMGILSPLTECVSDIRQKVLSVVNMEKAISMNLTESEKLVESVEDKSKLALAKHKLNESKTECTLFQALNQHNVNALAEASADTVLSNALLQYTLFETMDHIGFLNMNKYQMENFKKFLIKQ